MGRGAKDKIDYSYDDNIYWNNDYNNVSSDYKIKIYFLIKIKEESMIKKFLIEEDGMGTAEVVIISAVLVTMALLFKNTIKDIIQRVLKDNLELTDEQLKMSNL